MSYDPTEQSNYSGQPIQLYDIRYHNERWLFAATDNPQTLPGIFGGVDVYQPIATDDGEIMDSTDASQDGTSLRIPSTSSLATRLLRARPNGDFFFYIRRCHEGDPDAPIIWSGTIASAQRTEIAVCEIQARSMLASLRRSGLWSSYERNCPLPLYSPRCGVDKEAYKNIGRVAGMNGREIYINEAATRPDGYFAGGFMEWTNEEGARERKFIEFHAGSLIGVLDSGAGITVNLEVTLYAGCEHNMATCINRFNNQSNYGGFPKLPGVNPFAGDPVF